MLVMERVEVCGCTVRPIALLSVRCAASVTCTVKLNVPAWVGVPESVKVVPGGVCEKVSPGGRLPVEIQVNGDAPPFT